MLDIHRRTGYLFLGVVLGQILLISWQVQTSSGISFLQAGTFGVVSQVQIGASRLFGGFRWVWDGYFALRGAHEENQHLKDEVASLELRLQQMQALARRGLQLEQVLGVREQTSLKTVAAEHAGGAKLDLRENAKRHRLEHSRARRGLHLPGDQHDLRDHCCEEQISGTPVDVEHNARLGSRAAGGPPYGYQLSLIHI